MNTYGKVWLEKYDSTSCYHADLKSQRCLSSITPVFWRTDKPYMETYSLEFQKLIENAYEYGINSGVTAQIWGSQGLKGLFSLGLTSNSCLSEQRSHLELISPLVTYLILTKMNIHSTLVLDNKLVTKRNNL